MRILIAPYSKKLRNNKKNSKDYPWWPEVIDILKKKFGKEIIVIQIGSSSDPSLPGVDDFLYDVNFIELCSEINKCDTWASVDTYFHHVASYVKKSGVVVWSQSDPKHFGDKIHTNIFKDKKYFRKEQFEMWESANYDEKAFVEPNVVADAILELL